MSRYLVDASSLREERVGENLEASSLDPDVLSARLRRLARRPAEREFVGARLKDPVAGKVEHEPRRCVAQQQASRRVVKACPAETPRDAHRESCERQGIAQAARSAAAPRPLHGGVR